MHKIGLEPTTLRSYLKFAAGVENGLGGGIRTHDLLIPNQARYQTAPHPDVEELFIPHFLYILYQIFSLFSSNHCSFSHFRNLQAGRFGVETQLKSFS